MQTISTSSAVDSLFQSYADPDSAGAAVMVIQKGNILYRKGFGLASLEEKRPVTPMTNFRLASVTKQFTAMAIMILAEQQKLRYEDRLTDFFPDFPPYGNNITVRHLLTHTSGIVDYEPLIPDTVTVQVLDKDVLRMLARIDSTYFPAGTKYQYSNSGYALLALIVERTSSLSFAEFLKKYIFQPLGMSNTVAFENGISTVTQRAFGYSRTDSGHVFTDQSVTSAVLGDGGIYSSVDDLYKWDQALYTERLVRSSTLLQAFSPATLSDGSSVDYGFGWHLENYRGIYHPYHSGSTMGFRNVIFRIPEKQFTVIILTNRNEGEPLEIARKIADLYLFGTQ